METLRFFLPPGFPPVFPPFSLRFPHVFPRFSVAEKKSDRIPNPSPWFSTFSPGFVATKTNKTNPNKKKPGARVVFVSCELREPRPHLAAGQVLSAVGGPWKNFWWVKWVWVKMKPAQRIQVPLEDGFWGIKPSLEGTWTL